MYSCARTKTTAIVGEMANYAEERMASALKSKVFSVAINGSNDTNSQLYPILVTYYKEESGFIESRLPSLCTLKGQASGRNIGNLILETLASFLIPITNCVALG